MTAYEHAFAEDEVWDWLRRQRERYRQDGYGLWAVVRKETGEMIGQCGITNQQVRERTVPEVGYLFRRSCWRRGFATEAAKACRDYAFSHFHALEVFSIIRDTNAASQRVALRNGMTLRDTIVKHYWNVDMPHLVFSIRRAEWEADCAAAESLL